MARHAFFEGRVDDARPHADEALHLDERRETPVWAIRDRHLLGTVALVLGRPDEAIDVLRPAYDTLRRDGWADPGLFRFVSDLVEALVAVGRVADAEQLLDECWEDAKRLGRRAALAGLLRGRAISAAARREFAGAAADAAEAAAVFGELGQPFEHARSLLVLGHLQRELGRDADAATSLSEARRIFERFGLTQLSARASLAPHVQVLGGFRVTVAGDDVEVPVGKPAQIVKYLCCTGGRAPAEVVIDAIWRDADAATGRKGLRNALTRLRRDADELVQRDGDSLLLQPGTEVDLWDFDLATERAAGAERDTERIAAAREVAARFGGELLPDDLYDDWTVAARERSRIGVLRALDLLIASARDSGDGSEARRLLERAIAIDPYGEQRHLLAVELAVADGDRLRAVAALERGEQVLGDAGLPVSNDWSTIRRQVAG